VQAYNPAGYGPLPAAGSFNVNTTVPGIVARISPVDTVAPDYIETGGMPEYAPEFEWETDPLATDYYLNVVGPPVYNSKTKKWVPNTVVSQWVKSDACDPDTCSLKVQGLRLVGGVYTWYVQAYDPAGYGAPAAPYGSFNINTTPPDGVDLIWPDGGTNGDYTPLFEWTKSPMATDYYVYVAGPPVYNKVKKKWYTNLVFTQSVKSEVACPSGNTCSLQSPALAVMNYTWHVVPSSPAGNGPILEYLTFNPSEAVPGQVDLIAPENDGTLGYIVDGGIPEYAPKYEWTAVDTATKYYVYVAGPNVYNKKTGKWVANPVVTRWVTAAEAACVSVPGTCSLQGPTLPAASYTWYVQAYNPSGGSTATSGTFKTSATPPPAVTFMDIPEPPVFPVTVTPIGFDYNPTYRWGKVDGATQYLVYVAGPPVYNSKTKKWVANPVLNTWFPADAPYCDDTMCSVPKTQSPTLVGGSTYTWQVQAYSPAGYAAWSPLVTFSPNVQTPPTGVINMQVNGVPNNKPKDEPVFTWQKVPVATSYRLYVSGTNGVMLDKWVRSVDVCPTDVCSVEMPTTLATDKYTWWVQTYNVLGYGPWRSAVFNVQPVSAAATNLQQTAGTLPTYSWDNVTTATKYRLYVRGSTGAVVLDQWYLSSAICPAGCSVVSPNTLESGDYTWSVMTYNSSAGYGIWSSKTFNIP